ncbi:glucose-6-phosphate isomerase [Pseudonocardia xinjiangensis]|uniref:Glucose-6-phosphate isomerase n=1 Tax=Pseudonocardia xinjiangensis TaxID=75289 RepID=A0ABX1RMF2_9PSEU|nr:glucose-6-phosphate isomerase [Pseudonocardia xinjiangensis]NMH81567.1 glucose-6-phosphate isomerase [Pseudonocardia xinjiangensis]
MTARLLSSVSPQADVVERLVGDAVASRIAECDPTLWPRAARPGWVVAPRTSRPLVGQIEALREQLRVAGQVRVVLAAAGGVGVAAEALSDADPRLIVLDTTDPAQVADALAGDLAATVLVVSVPPGEDPAPVQLVRDTVHRAFRADGLDPDEHTVVVTAPGGPLQEQAGAATVVLGPSDVDGLWAALTAFALVPAGLAGTDVGAVLADAVAARAALAADDPANPCLTLGALLAAAPVVALAEDGAPGLAEWAAQLLGGGLGKDGRGPLPVVVEGPDAPEWADPESVRPGTLTAGLGEVPGAAVTTVGPPAAQLVLWQHATAVAAHLMGVDPTDRPDSDRGPAGQNGGSTPGAGAHFTDGDVDVHAGAWLPTGTSTVAEALRALVGTAEAGAHLTVHAYLDRLDDASAAVLRPELTRRTGLPTTFGWAPRCLPGGGQRDKGGPADAVVCQLTGDAEPDLPGELAELQQAQARADAEALAERGLPVLRLHFTDRVAGLVTLARAVQQL